MTASCVSHKRKRAPNAENSSIWRVMVHAPSANHNQPVRKPACHFTTQQTTTNAKSVGKESANA